MLSYDVVEHGKPLQLRLRDTPRPTGREVLVRITRAGLCHSDLHLREGWFDLGDGRKALLSERGMLPPLTLGHEPLGIVAALGPQAEGAAIGDKRLVFPWIGCGTCWACDSDQPNLCAAPRNLGVAAPGAFSTHMIVPDSKYLVDVTGLDDAFAATLACSGVTSYAAVAKLPPLVAGDRVAVLGCGGVGLLAVSALQALGCEHVIACDIDDVKLEAARKLGASHVLRSDSPTAASDLVSMTGGRLAGALDFVGIPATFNLAYPALRKGGRLVLVGLNGGQVAIALPPVAQRGVSVVGSFVGNPADLRAVVDLARSGRLRPTPVATRPAGEINEAFDDLAAGRIVGRTVLDFSVLDIPKEPA